ncbi:MAG: hypothetical protein JXB47_17345 [Anaerolineae bacterium]|nr:hypothetical protein [Anaerolineae bacterium]
MLDRLRRDAMGDDEEDEDELGAVFDDADVVQAAAAEDDLLFGLTPAQRLVLSVFLFLDVTVVGCMLLLALGRINI